MYFTKIKYWNVYVVEQIFLVEKDFSDKLSLEQY